MLDRETNLFLVFDPTLDQSNFNKQERTFKNNDVFEVGIFDHHNFIVKTLKSQLLKENAKTKLYQDYNPFSLEFFKEDLENIFITEYSDFQNAFKINSP